MMAGFMASTSALGQVTYSTPPYSFVTIAGTAYNSGSADGTNGDAQFFIPRGVAVATNDVLYVVDNYENNVRKIAPQGTNWVVTTIAGTAGVTGVLLPTGQI